MLIVRDGRLAGIHMTQRILALSLDFRAELRGYFFTYIMNIREYVKISSSMGKYLGPSSDICGYLQISAKHRHNVY